MGNYSKTLSYSEKVLEIKQQSPTSNHPDLAKCYIDHDIVYAQMSENEKAVEIQQQSFSLNNPHLSMSYNNIVLVYKDMGNFSKAHSCFGHWRTFITIKSL
jgi:tetratricopeptide (TPR) repeat protein